MHGDMDAEGGCHKQQHADEVCIQMPPGAIIRERNAGGCVLVSPPLTKAPKLDSKHGYHAYLMLGAWDGSRLEYDLPGTCFAVFTFCLFVYYHISSCFLSVSSSFIPSPSRLVFMAAQKVRTKRFFEKSIQTNILVHVFGLL